MAKNYTKTTLLAIFVWMASYNANSQITITSAQMPSSGDTIRYHTALASPGFNPTETGADFTWDFSSLQSLGQGLYEFKLSGQTPYLFNFGFTAIGLKIADSIGTGQFGLRNIYSFTQKNTSKYSARGLGFQISAFPLPLAGTYSSEDIIYNFPLNFGDSFSKTFALTIPLGAGPLSIGTFYRSGERTTVVDGWGTISTPFHSDVPCLRVKSIINSIDSIASQQLPGGFAFPTNEIEYKWLVLGEKIPLLEIRGTQFGNNFTPTSIRYRNGTVSQNNSVVQHEAPRISIYPNPAKDILYLNNLTEDAVVKFFSLDGKEVLSGNVSQQNNQIQLSNLPSGIYSVKVIGENNFITLRLLIIDHE